MWISRKRYNELTEKISNAPRVKATEDIPEEDMKIRLIQLFNRMSNIASSAACEASLLPSITNAMLEIYRHFRTIQ